MAATVPDKQTKRFAAYVDRIAEGTGHADRAAPLRAYCTGLLLPGERKSVEPMAARLAPENVRRMHQSLHHLVADAPWSDEQVLRKVRNSVLPAMEKKGQIVCWIVDDTGFPKKGTHSVGVARQYCGQVGKQENCRVAVSLSVANWNASLPISWRLYLPEIWTSDPKKRLQTGIPDGVEFQTKPQIALEQIRQAVAEQVPVGIVIADAGYGTDSRFRNGVSEIGLEYVVGVQSSTSVWEPGKGPLPAKPWKGRGRRTSLLRRDKHHRPVSAKQLALSLPAQAWQTVHWRKGTKHKLKSRFAAVRIRPAHRDYWQAEPNREEWLLIEWPRQEAEPTKYWLSTMPMETKVNELVLIAKQRWLIERDYQELKQELGLGHYEGRGWRGFHHHATLCIAAYGFLVMERSRFSPSAHSGNVRLSAPELPHGFRPRGAGQGRAA